MVSDGLDPGGDIAARPALVETNLAVLSEVDSRRPNHLYSWVS